MASDPCKNVYTCGVCEKQFDNIMSLNTHRHSHYDPSIRRHFCPHCLLRVESLEALNHHVTLMHADQPLPGRYRCYACHKNFHRFHHLMDHRAAVHRTRADDRPGEFLWDIDPTIDPPWVSRDETGEAVRIDEELKALVEEKKAYIVDGHDLNGRVQGFYNYALNGFNGNISRLKDLLLEIVKLENRAFRISLSFGLVLKHVETGEYKYYTAWLNNLSTTLFRISLVEDAYDYMEVLESTNLLEKMMSRSASTKWKVQFVSNVTFIVFRTEYPIGAMQCVELPAFLLNSKSVTCLHKNTMRELYKDRLCVFRCLAANTDSANLEKRTLWLYTKWRNYQIEEGVDSVPENPKRFKGIHIADLPQFEECFRVRLSVYSLKEDQSCVRIYSPMMGPRDGVRKSLNLNLYESHFSLITDLVVYAKTYGCHFCGRAFPKIAPLKRHQKSCCSRVKYAYPGGIYRSPITIFEELKLHLGIEVDKELQFYPYFAVYDFEAILKPIERPEGEESTGCTEWTTEHVPICVSVCSNVPGYTAPYAITDVDPDSLVKGMCDRLELIQIQAVAANAERWKSVTVALKSAADEYSKDLHDRLMDQVKATPAPVRPRYSEDRPHESSDEDSDDDDEYESDVEDPEESEPLPEVRDPPSMSSMEHVDAQFAHTKRVERLKRKFEVYAEVLPVLGYNSSRYDLNLIKRYFPKHFNLTNDMKYVIKKTNQYTAIATSKFKFLDMSNYLAAGSSYSRFLAAYGVSETKSFFPYEYFHDADQLVTVTELPAKECFFSRLKNANVLDADHDAWERAGRHGAPPKTGQQNYDDLKSVWRDRDMKNLGDFLEYYVNLDTGPFVTATQILLDNYRCDDVDVFKNAVSAPGIARKMLFDSSNKQLKYFASFTESQADLYWKLKMCSFGGPSIIFKRYAKAGETCIRNDPAKVVQKIVGYDSNSLYLFALSKELPVLFPVRRRAERQYKPELVTKTLDMYHWMEYIAETEHIKIQHKLLAGVEFTVGPYYLDGYSTCKGVRRGFEYNGCFYHGHDSSVCRTLKYDTMSEETKALMAKRRKNTKERADFITDFGVELTVIYECEFAEMKKDNRPLNNVLNKFLPPFYMNNMVGKLTQREILHSIVEVDEPKEPITRLRGIVQVDLHVPDTWNRIHFHLASKDRFPGDILGLTPKQYFSEMAPIFCNGTVEHGEWGATMQSYAAENEVDPAGRKLLLGGMRAEKIFLSTDLLRWYMQQGLICTKVHEVIEYKFAACFSEFRDKICRRRREGDTDPLKDVLGATAKVLGNAAYGSMMLDKTKHTRVKYVHNKHEAHLAVNDPAFKSLTELPGDLYEIEMSKKRTVLDLPIQLAFCILQYAKLEILSFYYDFLLQYVERADFELTHMDTDSLYFTISAAQLSDVIKPSKRKEWTDSLYHRGCKENVNRWNSPLQWFPRECCAEHRQYDKRVPGLFKLEASGSTLIALAPKTYTMTLTTGIQTVKSKGVQKKAVSAAIPLYSAALFDQKTGYATNVGLRAKNNTIMTYEQRKKGFSFFYVKRVVQADGISTVPHQTTLSPWTDYNVCILGEDNCLSNDFPHELYKHEYRFNSATHLFLYEKAVRNNCPVLAEAIGRAGTSQTDLYRAAARIVVIPEWYVEREQVMRDVVEFKISLITEAVIDALREIGARRIVQPGHASNNYFSCGYDKGMAEVMDPKSYPGHDFMSVFWEQKLYDKQFMGVE